VIRIKMLKPFQALKEGQVLDQTDGVAELWIHNSRAERMVPVETVEVKTAPKQRRHRKQREALV